MPRGRWCHTFADQTLPNRTEIELWKNNDDKKYAHGKVYMLPKRLDEEVSQRRFRHTSPTPLTTIPFSSHRLLLPTSPVSTFA